MDHEHENNVAKSIALARANAAANRTTPPTSADRATQTVREELKLEKYASQESKDAGEPPFETKLVTVETVIDKETGEVISREVSD